MFLLFNIIFCLFTLLYELEKKSSLVTRAFSAKSCTRDTDSLHSCTRLRLVQEMACLYHECKILPRKHSYPNLIPIIMHGQSCTVLQHSGTDQCQLEVSITLQSIMKVNFYMLHHNNNPQHTNTTMHNNDIVTK